MQYRVQVRSALRLSLFLILMAFDITQPAPASPVTVRIVSPSDGTAVVPGQTLTVTVDASPNQGLPGVALISPLATAFKTSPPFVFTLNIPIDAPLGPQPLTAFIGLAEDKFVESAITIHIETTMAVTRIGVKPPFFVATEETISVSGTFADGVTRKITRSRETAYRSSDPEVVTISADGLIEPIETGTATITVTYKGQAFSFPVQVNFTPPDRILLTCASLLAVVESNRGTALADKIEDAHAKCETGYGELSKTPPDEPAAVGNLEGAVGDLQAAVTAGLLDAAQGGKFMDRLARTTRQLAIAAVERAVAQGGDPVMLAAAQQAVTEGDQLRTSGLFKGAVSKYKDALAKARTARGA